MNKNIKRNKYFKKIKNFINKDLIKVLVGQRRVGKSKLLLQIISYLKNDLKVKNEEIIYINKEDLSWDFVNDYKALYEETKNFKYIFIDEVQNIDSWEKAVLSLQSLGKDVYITGSNSNLLSSNLATNLRGRYIKIDIYPLDYLEFLEFFKLQKGQESFLKYIKFGGMPYLLNLKLEQEVVYQYLKSIAETIVLKDIVERFSIRNVAIFNKLIIYIAQNIGSIFSSTNISNFLKNQKISLSFTTILGYLEYLKIALIVNEVPRYDLKGKKIFEIRQKYFFTDWGIRNAFIGGYKKIDIGIILENLVYMNLLSNGWEIKVGEIGKKEVDFVCEKDGEIMYIQVAYLLESEETKKREFSSLLDINDSWSKYVLTMDREASGSIEGVKWMNVENFLLNLKGL